MSESLGGGLIKHGKEVAHKLKSDPPDANVPMPGLEILGSGFDALGRCHVSSKKANIFDFLSADQHWRDQVFIDRSLAGVEEKAMQAFNTVPENATLTYRIPALVDFAATFEAHVETTRTSTLTDFQASLGVGADIDAEVGMFSGEFSARFDMKQMQMASTTAYSVNARLTYAQLSMDNYNQSKPAPMRPGVQDDLDGVSKDGRRVLSAEEVLDTYGTHYVRRFDLGTMIVLSFTNDTSRNSTDLDLSVALKARYEAGGEGGGGKLDAEMSSKLAKDQSALRQNTHCWGFGDDQIDSLNLLTAGQTPGEATPAGGGAAGHAGGETADAAATTPIAVLRGGWHNPTLVGIEPADLVPVWTLCKEPARQEEIKQAYKARSNRAVAKAPTSTNRLVPIFRFRRATSDNPAAYRLSTSIKTPDVPAGWSSVYAENGDGQPIFCVRSEPGPDLVALYAWTSTTGEELWRYETASWDEWMGKAQKGKWRKFSGTPIGYVFDGLGPKKAPADSVPVYAYYPSPDGGFPRFYYSTDSSDAADKFGWEHSLRCDRPWDTTPGNTTERQAAAAISSQIVAYDPASPRFYAFRNP